MNSPEILYYSSADEMKSNMKTISNKFIENGVVVVRGAHLTEKEHVEIVKTFGDECGTFPNTSAGRLDIYTENHARLSEISATKDEILVSWHLEHVETADPKEIIVGGIWNMYKYTTSSENGNTYFVDTAKLFSSLPSETQEILRNTVFEWFLGERPTSSDELFRVPAVGTHWSTGDEVLRISLNTSKENIKALNLDGTYCSEEDNNLRVALWEECAKTITQGLDLRITHQWEEGDIVFVDLYKNAHAVAGGFSYEDREFTGLWLYSIDNNEEHLN